jgi:hypothetical protein
LLSVISVFFVPNWAFPFVLLFFPYRVWHFGSLGSCQAREESQSRKEPKTKSTQSAVGSGRTSSWSGFFCLLFVFFFAENLTSFCFLVFSLFDQVPSILLRPLQQAVVCTRSEKKRRRTRNTSMYVLFWLSSVFLPLCDSQLFVILSRRWLSALSSTQPHLWVVSIRNVTTNLRSNCPKLLAYASIFLSFYCLPRSSLIRSFF